MSCSPCADNAKYVRNAVCDRLLAGPVLQGEREDVLHRLSQGDYVQWVLLLTRDMPFKVRAGSARCCAACRCLTATLSCCSCGACTACGPTGCSRWRLA